MTLPPNDAQVCNEQASVWMHCGIDLMQQNTVSTLEEAVRCFDEAIALRRTLPLAENPRHRYGLAAGYMNRGDALALLGGKEQLADSIKSYDQALKLVHDLPFGEDPLYPRRVAIAWINRGFASQKQKTAAALIEAQSSFREAIAILESPQAAAIPDHLLLWSGALINLAGALLDAPDPSTAPARAAALKARSLIQHEERNQQLVAETGLKARHVLCRALAMESLDEYSIPRELIAEATDAVDEGLDLARHWERKGEHRFRTLAEDLFRFGCRIYQIHQPNFLTEFILESLDPETVNGSPPFNLEMHDAAVAALWNALKEIQRDGFRSLSTPHFEQVLENLRELRVTEERLNQLRRAGPSDLNS